MGEKIRVIIVDDHAVVRIGLISILETEPEVEVVGLAKDGVEAIRKVEETRPDVVLMDIFMPRCGGLEAMATIAERFPEVKVLILTVSDQEENLFKALRLGAKGYLLKEANINEVVEAVKMTAAGETMLSPHVVAKLVAEFRGKDKAEGEELPLSAREMQVLQLVAEGFTNTEITSQLFIAESTVRTYLRRILEKLHLRNRAEAIAYATRHLLTRPAKDVTQP